MTSLSYYLPYRNLQSRSKSFFAGYLSMLEELSLSDKAKILSSATRCLAIGTNSGECEIELIKKFMPKLLALTAIEPDAASAAELRKNLQQRFSNVVTDVHEEKFQQVFGSDLGANGQQYDVILMFQCLYHFPAEDRRALYKALQNTILAPDGVAIVLHGSRSDAVGDLFEIGTYVGAPSESALLTDKEIQSEMESAGFRLIYENGYVSDLDLRDADQDVADFFSNWLGGSVTAQKLNEAVRKACPDSMSLQNYSKMMWFQK